MNILRSLLSGFIPSSSTTDHHPLPPFDYDGPEGASPADSRNGIGHASNDPSVKEKLTPPRCNLSEDHAEDLETASLPDVTDAGSCEQGSKSHNEDGNERPSTFLSVESGRLGSKEFMTYTSNISAPYNILEKSQQLSADHGHIIGALLDSDYSKLSQTGESLDKPVKIALGATSFCISEGKAMEVDFFSGIHGRPGCTSTPMDMKSQRPTTVNRPKWDSFDSFKRQDQDKHQCPLQGQLLTADTENVLLLPLSESSWTPFSEELSVSKETPLKNNYASASPNLLILSSNNHDKNQELRSAYSKCGDEACSTCHSKSDSSEEGSSSLNESFPDLCASEWPSTHVSMPAEEASAIVCSPSLPHSRSSRSIETSADSE